MKTITIFRKAIFTFTFLIILFSCKNVSEKPVIVDFSSDYSNEANLLENDTVRSLNVVVSTMISPKETFIYYKELFQYISEKINRKVVFKQKKTYKEVNDMLINKNVDIAFICSGAYIQKSEELDIMVAPVCNGLPYYQAYVIVHKDSEIQEFTELENKSFAYTDPLSNTGKLYAEKRVKEINGSLEGFFAKTIFSNAHDISLQMVSKKVVDGASIDGLIYEYMKIYYPEKIENIKIIEKSEYYGIPPIVTSDAVDSALKEQLKNLFLEMHEGKRGKEILDNLLIDKFTIVGDTLYDNIRAMQNYVCQ